MGFGVSHYTFKSRPYLSPSQAVVIATFLLPSELLTSNHPVGFCKTEVSSNFKIDENRNT